MTPPSPRVITAPVRLTGSIHSEQLSSLVAIDALVRRRTTTGAQAVQWDLLTLAGDVAVQRAVERAVARSGEHRADLGRDEFAERARLLEDVAAVDLRRLLEGLDIRADLDRWSASSEDAARAARIAFVRLYEAGVLFRTDAVLDTCPSCETVIDAADTDEVEFDVDRLCIELFTSDGLPITLEVTEPELLVGVVAVAVPPVFGLAGSTVEVPLLDAPVPIVSVDGLDQARVVVPGHDQWSWELVQQLGLRPVEVLDGQGVVRHPGPLEGLGRFAARSAAVEMLAARGQVVETVRGTAVARRCHRCGTVLVPLRGRHWLLSFETLVEPVLDMIREGAMSFSPAEAREHFAAAGERAGTWCVSQQLWSGHPIPVATCLDCGQTRVSVEPSESCGSCMGTLEAHPDVLDARFIAAVTPSAMLGWPSGEVSAQAPTTTLSIGRSGLDTWALPMAALGLRLADAIPFAQVVVHQLTPGALEPGPRTNAEFASLTEQVGIRELRVALLSADLDMERAAATVALLSSPPVGTGHLDDVVEAYDEAVGALDAGNALGLLVETVAAGVTPASAARLRDLVDPLLGS